MSGFQPPDCSKLATNPKNDNEVKTFQHDVIVKFFVVAFFLLSILVTCRSFMSISLLVLELWQFSFIRDWPEIRKSEISPSELCPISGDWSKLWVPNLAQMILILCYWILQNSRVTAFYRSGFYRSWVIPPSHTTTQIRVKRTKIQQKILK